ncbi:hypothetical protein OSTOST_03009 [Ostertagia ostertagi]
MTLLQILLAVLIPSLYLTHETSTQHPLVTPHNSSEIVLSCGPAENFIQTHMAPDFESPQLVRRLDWFHDDALVASYQQGKSEMCFLVGVQSKVAVVVYWKAFLSHAQQITTNVNEYILGFHHIIASKNVVLVITALSQKCAVKESRGLVKMHLPFLSTYSFIVKDAAWKPSTSQTIAAEMPPDHAKQARAALRWPKTLCIGNWLISSTGTLETQVFLVEAIPRIDKKVLKRAIGFHRPKKAQLSILSRSTNPCPNLYNEQTLIGTRKHLSGCNAKRYGSAVLRDERARRPGETNETATLQEAALRAMRNGSI